MDDLVSTSPRASVRLIPDWKWVLRKGWSARFAALAIVTGAIDILLPLFSDRFTDRTFAWISVGSMVLSLGSRILLQKRTGVGL
jgi:hypothetical protein